jgi:hypothetical protein
MTRRWFAVAALLLAACGEEQAGEGTPDAGSTACATPAAERLLPLAVGRRWTYQVSEDGGPATIKATTVEILEDVGGTKAGTVAYRVRTEKIDGVTVSWQEDTCDGIVRHREQSFDLAGALDSDQYYVPGKPRVDDTAAHRTAGATWVTEYTEVEEDPVTGAIKTTSKADRWTVEAVDEEVTVPAGTYRALRLHRVGEEDGQAEKRYWFAPGVGKLREEGSQLEELAAVEAGE